MSVARQRGATPSLPGVVISSASVSATTSGENARRRGRAQEYDGCGDPCPWSNGSTDATAAIAARSVLTCCLLPNLRVVPVPVTRPSALGPRRRPGAIRARSALRRPSASLLDSDDQIAAPGYILSLSAGARIRARSVVPHDSRSVEQRPECAAADADAGRADRHVLPTSVSASSEPRWAPRRDVLEQVGGFDEALPTQHDLDICWRPRALGVTRRRAGGRGPPRERPTARHLPAGVPDAVCEPRRALSGQLGRRRSLIASASERFQLLGEPRPS
jgi:hypothetical protein